MDKQMVIYAYHVDILEAITESGFYTEDPEEACIFVPPFNLLNEAILGINYDI